MPSKAKKGKALQQKARAPQRGNGHGNGSSYGARNSQETSFVPFNGTAAPRRGQNGFTLQEEARNTERHQSFWNTDQRLRHNKVNFVGAGTLDPRELEEDPETALAEMTLDSPQEDLEAPSEEPVQEPTPVGPSPLVEEQSSAYFVVDTLGEPVSTGLALPRVRSTSPTPSNSSEEVILFGGRDPKGKGISRERKVRKPQSASIDTKIKIVEDQIHVREGLLEEVLQGRTSPLRSFQPQSRALALNQSRSLLVPGPKGNRHQSNEEAIIADYIANMDKDDDLSNNIFRARELGGAEDAVWQDEMDESSGEPILDSVEPVQGGWERSDICDFDELSTSDEVMGTVQEILSKRERESGVQYLVVWEHETTDDARWVPVTTLTAIGALSLIELFEAEEKLVAEFMDQGDEDTSDSEDDADINDSEGDEDDDDLVQRKIDRMSDEQIARMLTKQEELGMGSSELLLFGGEADAGEDIEDNLDMDVPGTVLDPFLLGPTLDQYSGRAARRPRGDFPSASALADSYDGFDVMDFERPSLKKKPKGRKGKIAFDLSDSELEASMQMAFENDRFKKKERKQEREELRAQGLLGNKNSKPDLKQKFKEGMSIHDVKDQIKGFLMGSNTTLSLPPMAKADRKVVHELGTAFSLKSKSVGSGKSRAPILTRTSRTPRYLESNFDAVEARLSRRYLPRMDVGHKQRVQRAPRGGNSAGVSYKDGDVVGASAPELGVENRGRAMLEKMGWSTGTALGALNNKGILQPVSHVVKTSKAGLG
ncbi:Protein SQS1 [Lachnellula occidentalis]|uniref:Protein SQS1 n=1 Tax=Lachnellula occidentalis TaxID=215460 RepID=A0A8H8UDC9_9HELO|nr:Protein SQS1 [Lachnellula occidentalis]